MTAIYNINNQTEIRKKGLQALTEVLGPVGMLRFIQQYDSGYGDYTEEKYKNPDLNIDEIDLMLKNNRVWTLIHPMNIQEPI